MSQSYCYIELICLLNHRSVGFLVFMFCSTLVFSPLFLAKPTDKYAEWNLLVCLHTTFTLPQFVSFVLFLSSLLLLPVVCLGPNSYKHHDNISLFCRWIAFVMTYFSSHQNTVLLSIAVVRWLLDVPHGERDRRVITPLKQLLCLFVTQTNPQFVCLYCRGEEQRVLTYLLLVGTVKG